MSSTAIDQNPNSSKLNSIARTIWANDNSNDQFHGHGPPLYQKFRVGSSDITNARGNSSTNERASLISEPAQKTFRMERNLRFLKIQHQKMLDDLYLEIEALRSQNRELQFQKAFGFPLTDTLIINSENSAQVAQNSQPAIANSRVYISAETQTEPRVTPFQLNNVEDELHRLKLALEEAETRNSCLTSLVNQLKRSHLKLRSADNVTSRGNFVPGSSVQQAVKVLNPQIIKLEEYEKLTRQLRRENSDQKKELTQIRSVLGDYLKANKNSSLEDSERLRKLPQIPISKKSKPPHEIKNSIELPPLHPRSSAKRFSSKESLVPSMFEKQRNVEDRTKQ